MIVLCRSLSFLVAIYTNIWRCLEEAMEVMRQSQIGLCHLSVALAAAQPGACTTDCFTAWQAKQSDKAGSRRLFHAPTRTTSSGFFMLHSKAIRDVEQTKAPGVPGNLCLPPSQKESPKARPVQSYTHTPITIGNKDPGSTLMR